MKKLIPILAMILFCISCEKEEFNAENPDVKKFVEQIKNGTYDTYELGENGEKLWIKMPNFNENHIPLLISHSKDTALIHPCDHFPINPISSIPPHRIHNGKESIMIAEFLLWCVEGVIKGNTFPSLTPTLINESYNEDERLSGLEILVIRKIYQEWWEEYSNSGNANKLPLEGTVYKWR